MAIILKFLKSNVVLIIAAAAALISMIFTPPCEAYYGYIDWSVISLLFCLMATVQGFKSIGVFDRTARILTEKAKTPRRTAACLIILCFFFSMIITNDVALITFVPLTIILFRKSPQNLMITVILDTIAANLGSMLTPIGNPQNLYIYSHFNFTPKDFLLTMLPYCALSLILLLISLVFVRNKSSETNCTSEDSAQFKPLSCIVYCIMLLAALLTVFKIINFIICLAVCLLLMIIFSRNLFKKIDYSLLLTFICFFVFVGNLSQIEVIQTFLTSYVNKNEIVSSIVLSQVISNVPCAVMLSAFTENSHDLLIGVDIGGLGTLIASLASLISFRFYSSYENSNKKKYLLVFTLLNLLFMTVLILLYIII